MPGREPALGRSAPAAVCVVGPLHGRGCRGLEEAGGPRVRLEQVASEALGMPRRCPSEAASGRH